MLRLCLLQYLYGKSDRDMDDKARINLTYKYFLVLAVDEEPPGYYTLNSFRTQRLSKEIFCRVFQDIVQQSIDKGLVNG
jgi:transposase